MTRLARSPICAAFLLLPALAFAEAPADVAVIPLDGCGDIPQIPSEYGLGHGLLPRLLQPGHDHQLARSGAR
jgi:hypothetical protein